MVPIVVLSGSRTMFKNTIHVPVSGEASDEEIGAARAKLAELMEDEETLSQLRQFFVALGSHAEKTMAGYELPEEVATHASNQFQQARRTENERDGKVTTDDFVFHRYLNLARYMSIGKMGSLHLTNKCYDQAVQLELTRVGREEARKVRKDSKAKPAATNNDEATAAAQQEA